MAGMAAPPPPPSKNSKRTKLTLLPPPPPPLRAKALRGSDKQASQFLSESILGSVILVVIVYCCCRNCIHSTIEIVRCLCCNFFWCRSSGMSDYGALVEEEQQGNAPRSAAAAAAEAEASPPRADGKKPGTVSRGNSSKKLKALSQGTPPTPACAAPSPRPVDDPSAAMGQFDSRWPCASDAADMARPMAQPLYEPLAHPIYPQMAFPAPMPQPVVTAVRPQAWQQEWPQGWQQPLQHNRRSRPDYRQCFGCMLLLVVLAAFLVLECGGHHVCVRDSFHLPSFGDLYQVEQGHPPAQFHGPAVHAPNYYVQHLLDNAENPHHTG